MKFKYTFLILYFIGFSTSYGMLTETSDALIKNSISSGELEQQLEENKKRETFLKYETSKKAKLLSKIQNSSSSQVYLWEDESQKSKNRDSVEKLLKAAIRRHLDELARIQQLNSDILSQLEWMNHQTKSKEDLQTQIKSKNEVKISCADIPVSFGSYTQNAIVQDFGTKKDSLTGLEWNSLGWWISQKPASNIRACLKGKVVFSGPMQGRGYVVMIDHGDDFLTIYANLNQNHLVPKLGTVLKTGESIGTSLDSLYFEVRHKGKSLNPRLVFARQNLDILGL